MIRRILATTAAALMLSAGLSAGTLPSAAAAASSVQCPGDLGSKTPVLLVHGYNDNATAWENKKSRNDPLLPFCNGRTWARAFNYGDASRGWDDPSLQWVADDPPGVGQALAGEIANLAAKSADGKGPGKVIVIAHSMGGLALRCALVNSCGHQGDLTGRVEGVVTFDTPNTGSFLRGNGSIAENALVDVATQLASAGCFAAELRAGPVAVAAELFTKVCQHFWGKLTGPAATAFTPGSPQLGKEYGTGTLPALANTVPLDAVAGSIQLQTTLFYRDVSLGDVGDLVVGEDSAFAAANHAGATKKTISCGQLNLSGLNQLFGFVGSGSHAVNGTKIVIPSCWHGPEPRTAPFLDEARQAVDRFIAANAPGTDVVTLTPVDQQGNPTAGYSVADGYGPVACYGWADDAKADDIFDCGGSGDDLAMCWPTNARTAVLCLPDPWQRQLVRHSVDTLPSSTSKPGSPEPLGIELDSGEHCLLRHGGAVDAQTPTGYAPNYYCGNNLTVWSATSSGIDTTLPTWSVRVGGQTGPLTVHRVTRAYFVATAPARASTTKPVRTTQNSGGPLITIWAEDHLTNCAANAHGAVADYLRSHPCRRIHRYLATTTLNNRPVAFTDESVSFGGPGVAESTAYREGADFSHFVSQNGTGSTNDLLSAGKSFPNGPSSIPHTVAFAAPSQDGQTDVVNCWYLEGPTTVNDPSLIRFANSPFLWG